VFAIAAERANGLNMGRFLHVSIDTFSFLVRNQFGWPAKPLQSQQSKPS
jgi:hypothetical protein